MAHRLSKPSYQIYNRILTNKIPLFFFSKAVMHKVFTMFDKDGNGRIDKQELLEVFAEMGKVFSETDVQRMIDIADTDQSGALEYEEFIEIVMGSIGKI